MTRAEWYAVHAGGWWRKCRVPFRCDQEHHGVRCENKVAHEGLYFDTNTPKFYGVKDARRFVKKRMCFSCSYELVPEESHPAVEHAVAHT